MEGEKGKNKEIEVVSYRLDFKTKKKLLEISNEKNISPHEYAKQELIKNLTGESEAKNLEEYIEKRFNKLEDMTKTVGLDLFFAVQKLLSHVTDSDIREWLKENMKALEWNIKES